MTEKKGSDPVKNTETIEKNMKRYVTKTQKMQIKILYLKNLIECMAFSSGAILFVVFYIALIILAIYGGIKLIDVLK